MSKREGTLSHGQKLHEAIQGARLLPAHSQSFWHSKSTVALSVSISQKTSPALTSSPSLTVQDEIVPAVMVGDRVGSPTTVWSGTAHARTEGKAAELREAKKASDRKKVRVRLLRARANTPQPWGRQTDVHAGALSKAREAVGSQGAGAAQAGSGGMSPPFRTAAEQLAFWRGAE